jgi:hypothetical protein
MRCEKCNKEKKTGAYYEFHYGKSISYQQIAPFPSEKYRATYRIEGSRRSWICRACVVRGVLSPVGIGMIFWAVLAVIITASDIIRKSAIDSQCIVTVGSILAIICFFTGISFILNGINEIGVSGENRAIEANRPGLKEAGYDKLLNHRDYRKIRGF